MVKRMRDVTGRTYAIGSPSEVSNKIETQMLDKTVLIKQGEQGSTHYPKPLYPASERGD